MTSIDNECGPYCDRFGDCLNCYSEDPCMGEDGQEHSWPTAPLDLDDISAQ